MWGTPSAVRAATGWVGFFTVAPLILLPSRSVRRVLIGTCDFTGFSCTVVSLAPGQKGHFCRSAITEVGTSPMTSSAMSGEPFGLVMTRYS